MNNADLITFINQNPVFSLATCLDNVPHIRHIQVIKADKSEIIFNAKKYKPVYQQLIANPNVELCFYNQDLGTQIRLSGKVIEIFSDFLVEELLSKHPDLQNQITKYGKDVIRLFSLKNWKASYWDRSNKELTIELTGIREQ